jgi:hypothetical protein
MSEVIEKAQAKQDDKRAVFLDPQRMGLAEHGRQDWVVNAAAGTSVQDVLNPQYWAHMAAQMQPYDRIDVRLETGEWMLELLVGGVGRNWAQVHLLHQHELTKLADVMPRAQHHRVEWKGPQRKWAVIRLSDDEILQDGKVSRAEAQAWLEQHEKLTGA